MAEETEILVKIAADVADLKRGLDEAYRQIETTASKMQGAADASSKMSAGMEEAVSTGARLGATMGTVVGSVIVWLIEKFAELAINVALTISRLSELNFELEKLSAKTGMSMKDLSDWHYAAQQSGVSAQTFDSAIQMLDRNLSLAAGGNRMAKSTFEGLGISILDAQGHVREGVDVMSQMSDMMHETHDGAVKVQDAFRTMGGAGGEMIGMLNQGSAKLKELRGENDAYSRTVERMQPQLDEFRHRMDQITASFQLFFAQIAEKIMPAINTLIRVWEQWWGVIDKNDKLLQAEPGYLSAIGTGVQGLAGLIAHLAALFEDLAATAKLAFEVMAEGFGGVGHAIAAAASLDWTGVKTSFSKMTTDMTTSFDEFGNKIIANAAQLQSNIDKIFNPPETGAPGTHGGLASTGTGEMPTLDSAFGATKNPWDAWSKQIMGAMDDVMGSFNSMISGMLTGTQSFKDGLRKMLQALVMDFISAMEKMLERWIMTQIMQTASTAQQAAIQKTIKQSADSADMAGLIARTVASIGASSAQTSIGATAWFSPILGPAAPAAGAAVAASSQAAALAQLGAFTMLETGAWSLNDDVIAHLHKGEMVVPQNFAEGMRDGGGDGMGGTHFHFHGTVIGSRKFFEDNGEHIAGALRKQVRNAHPATRPQHNRL